MRKVYLGQYGDEGSGQITVLSRVEEAAVKRNNYTVCLQN